jgi:glucose/arabinose dehydrogenase
MLALMMAACQEKPNNYSLSQITPSIPPLDTPAVSMLPATIPESPFPAEPLTVHTFPDSDNVGWLAAMGGLSRPVDLQSTPAYPDLFFILEQSGKILTINQLTFKLEGVFLDIQEQVGSSQSEQGLLGMAFAPAFPSDARIYINYTDNQGTTKISRFRVDLITRQVDPTSEEILLSIQQPYANHNGGGLAFGPDGYLYIGMGDGGSAGDPQGYAQNMESLLGKMLRIDVSPSTGYTIPGDNPFRETSQPEIWHYGLRNPWRFHFDTLTGDLYIADVGQRLWEEVHVIKASQPGGLNLGWNLYEGFAPYQNEVETQQSTNLTFPVITYDHQAGCSITGGVVFREIDWQDWQGIYLYGDFCSGTIWGLLPLDDDWKSEVLFETDSSISAFGQDAQKQIYYLDYSDGILYQLRR